MLVFSPHADGSSVIRSLCPQSSSSLGERPSIGQHRLGGPEFAYGERELSVEKWRYGGDRMRMNGKNAHMDSRRDIIVCDRPRGVEERYGEADGGKGPCFNILRMTSGGFTTSANQSTACLFRPRGTSASPPAEVRATSDML